MRGALSSPARRTPTTQADDDAPTTDSSTPASVEVEEYLANETPGSPEQGTTNETPRGPQEVTPNETSGGRKEGGPDQTPVDLQEALSTLNHSRAERVKRLLSAGSISIRGN
jgi:hypothetical protein